MKVIYEIEISQDINPEHVIEKLQELDKNVNMRHCHSGDFKSLDWQKIYDAEMAAE